MPIDSSDTLIDSYVAALKQEIDHYTDILVDKELKTLYF
jgi:coproporphyrinogen III oxidase-like Fe-S oxidoreductase